MATPIKDTSDPNQPQHGSTQTTLWWVVAALIVVGGLAFAMYGNYGNQPAQNTSPATSAPMSATPNTSNPNAGTTGANPANTGTPPAAP